MKKSDILTAIGLLAGLGLILMGMINDEGLGMFWDVSSIFITVGGSLSATLMTSSMEDVKNFIPVIVQSFKEIKVSNIDIINQFSSLAKRARKEGLLSLEEEISNLDDEFLKKGLQMVVDGIEPETIKEILELEISEMEDRHANNAGVISTWGAFAPAFGMLGTLIGLIQMLVSLNDASKIAGGMGKALITTFYGSLLANSICNPIATKLAKKNTKEVKNREMMLEGILAIQSGVNPRIVEEKLVTYLNPKDKAEFYRVNGENSEGVV